MSYSRPEGPEPASASSRIAYTDSLMNTKRYIQADRDNDILECRLPPLMGAQLKLVRWFVSSSTRRQYSIGLLLNAIRPTFGLLETRMDSLVAGMKSLRARIQLVPAVVLPHRAFPPPHDQEDAVELERTDSSLLLEGTLPKNTKESPDILLLKFTMRLSFDQAQICAGIIAYVLDVREEIMKMHKEWASEVDALVERTKFSTGTRAGLQHLARGIEVLNQSWHRFCTFISHTRVIGGRSEYMAQLEKDFEVAESLANQHDWAKLEIPLRHLVLCELTQAALEASDDHGD